MKVEKNYTFQVSLSNDAYTDKIISGAMIGSTKNEENRKVRKEYGFHANRGIGYMQVETNAETLLNNLLNGHVFCHLFTPKSVRTDGTFGSSQKKDENFAGSYVIGVDIDKTEYNTAEDFISTLSLQPTFYYTTYSNLKEDKGARFRLIYVFDTKIVNPYFFRYAAYCLNQIIEKDSNEKIDDDCNLRCSQYFNGTNRNNKDIILSYGLTNNIYSLQDINVSSNGFIDFLRHYCYYKTYNIDRIEYISNLLYKLTNSLFSFNRTTTYYIELQNDNTPEFESNITINPDSFLDTFYSSPYKCSEEFVSDMQRLDYDEFMKYNRHKYNYFYRVEKDEWIDGIYQYIDDDYFSLYWNTNTVRDGQKRRKKLFERMCLRRVMNPAVDADTLLFNAYEDVHRFFEVDKDLTIDCLVRNVENAMNLSIDDIKANYSENIEYLKSRKPKSGVIIKVGVSKNIADRNKVLKEIRWSLIADYYDTNLSVKENLINIKENLFEVSERTLYNFIKENGIKTDSNKVNDDELRCMLDSNLSVRENMSILKDKGIKVGNKRVMRILNDMKNNTTTIDTNITTTIYTNTNIYNILDNNNISNNYSISQDNTSITTTYYTDLQNDNTYKVKPEMKFGVDILLDELDYANN